MSEVRSRYDEIVERFLVLDASSKQLEWFAAEWPEMDEATRDGFYYANDAVLGQRLRDGQEADRANEIEMSPTPLLDLTLMEQEEADKERAEQDWGLLGLAIPTILDTVGDNASQAYRLYNLEQTADQPRTSLLKALEKIAWPHGKPENDDDDQSPV